MIHRDRLPLFMLGLIASLLGCARSVKSRVVQEVASNPCAQKKPRDLCVPELPTVAPVVAGEGRIWGLFARRGNFEIREYSSLSDGVLAQGSCPAETEAVVLGVIDQQPALLCANYHRGIVVFGRKVPNSQGFVWQAPEPLVRGSDEAVKAISHFALLDQRLSVVFRTEVKSPSSGLTTTQWRLQIASTKAQLARPVSSQKNTSPAQSEVLCPRPGVTRCDRPPVTAYVAEGHVHVILASGVSADKYLHLQQAPGKPSKTVPVDDVTMTGKLLKEPCVSKTTNGNLKVFVPSRNLVSALMGGAGDRVGVIEHGTASIAQGPDVFASDESHCPPEVPLALGSSNTPDARPQWLRATQSKDTWIIGYGVPPFAVQQNGIKYSYSESFWVVRR